MVNHCYYCYCYQETIAYMHASYYWSWYKLYIRKAVQGEFCALLFNIYLFLDKFAMVFRIPLALQLLSGQRNAITFAPFLDTDDRNSKNSEWELDSFTDRIFSFIFDDQVSEPSRGDLHPPDGLQ